jgi:3-dehydroquinate synthase
VTARVDVRLPGREYPILIGPGLLGDPDVVGRAVTARDVMVVTNETVGPLYLERARAGLACRRVHSLALPDGEAHKTLGTVSRIFDALVEARG